MRRAALVLGIAFVLCADGAAATLAGQRTTSWSIGSRAFDGFNVILLLGQASGSEFPSSLPSDASKALSDLKEFLPFKSYRLLDTRRMAGGLTRTRLFGPDGVEYDLELTGQLITTTRISVSKLFLRQVGGGLVPLEPRVDRGNTSGARAPVIDTALFLALDETVVVGASRLGADRALVLLLTARSRDPFPKRPGR